MIAQPTSQAAAAEIRPAIGKLRAAVLSAVRAAGLSGLTDQEIVDRTGLAESTARPRRYELVRAGLLQDSGKTRPTRSGRPATIWIAVDEPAEQSQLFPKTPSAIEAGY